MLRGAARKRERKREMAFKGVSSAAAAAAVALCAVDECVSLAVARAQTYTGAVGRGVLFRAAGE